VRSFSSPVYAGGKQLAAALQQVHNLDTDVDIVTKGICVRTGKRPAKHRQRAVTLVRAMDDGACTMEVRAGLPIMSFADRKELDDWLANQPAEAAGMWIKFAKKNAGKSSVSKAEAIDAALCHGWIDGQLDKYDDAHWLVRFTPRKAKSKWSEINRARALQLIETGQMREAGLAQVNAARADGRWEAAYAPARTAEIPPDLREALEKSPKAAKFFATLTGANRYAILYRIGAVKKPDTRARKIATYVAMLERGETIHG
jgi:uncharacterized protein YdeI (YjbR/CyaY-like superfamily)